MNKRYGLLFTAALLFIVLNSLPIRAADTPQTIDIQEKIILGGVKQAIMIRGADASNPVLLFLHGGPGFPEMPFAHIDSKDLEKNFIVVNWDQRGCGKSVYPEIAIETITLEQILSDANELVEYLKTRFQKKKIFLIGHSWGSILGIYTAYNHPENFHAYIGMGQVANSLRGEEISYQFALDKAKAANDSGSMEKLRDIGHPPFENYEQQSVQRMILAKHGGVFARITYQDVLNGIMASPDYTQTEKTSLMKAFIQVNNLLWRQVMTINFFDTVKELKIPIFFFLGKHDYNCPFEIAEKYLDGVRAPLKDIVWFENSGHWPNLEEPALYQKKLIAIKKKVLGLENAPKNNSRKINPVRNGAEAEEESADLGNGIHPLKNYIFYLHGRIIEEQGPDAVSPEYGRYLYRDIVQALAKSGAEVISEPRPRGTDPLEYARKIASQIKSLLKAGIPPGRILVIGASKGAGIAVLLSAILRNPELKFVLLAICNREMAAYWKKNNIRLWGKILYIYDSEDRIAGSCKPFPDMLKGPGLKEYRELELKMGLGHGILYAPHREWLEPARQWLERK